jgi:hypothetical protein
VLAPPASPVASPGPVLPHPRRAPHNRRTQGCDCPQNVARERIVASEVDGWRSAGPGGVGGFATSTSGATTPMSRTSSPPVGATCTANLPHGSGARPGNWSSRTSTWPAWSARTPTRRLLETRRRAPSSWQALTTGVDRLRDARSRTRPPKGGRASGRQEGSARRRFRRRKPELALPWNMATPARGPRTHDLNGYGDHQGPR